MFTAVWNAYCYYYYYCKISDRCFLNDKIEDTRFVDSVQTTVYTCTVDSVQTTVYTCTVDSVQTTGFCKSVASIGNNIPL